MHGRRLTCGSWVAMCIASASIDLSSCRRWRHGSKRSSPHIAAKADTGYDDIMVLKPGKDLVVSVPRYFPERICWALSKDYHLANDGHIRIYKKKELIDLLEAAGVKTWATHFAHSLHTPYWWLKCLVGPNRDDSPLVNLYHRFLVWDMMKQPWITRMLDCLLNSIIGKSVVIYLRKEYILLVFRYKIYHIYLDLTLTKFH